MTSATFPSGDCILCQPELADAHFNRARLWEDEHWRLSAVLQGPIAGFAHLEPRRHIPFITDLDGIEAATLGVVLSRATTALRAAARAERRTSTCSEITRHTCTSISHHTAAATRYVAVRDCWNPMPSMSVRTFIDRWLRQRRQQWIVDTPQPAPRVSSNRRSMVIGCTRPSACRCASFHSPPCRTKTRVTRNDRSWSGKSPTSPC